MLRSTHAPASCSARAYASARALLLLAALAASGAGCGDDEGAADRHTNDGGALPDGGQDDAGLGAGADVAFLNQLRSEADFDRLALASGGDGAQQAGVKYLARVDDRAPVPALEADCYFQNMNRYAWHLHFLQSFREHSALSYDAYRNLVLRKATRRLWGGAFQRWPAARHPATGERGVYAYTIYSEPGGIDFVAIAEVDDRMKGCAPFARERIVFVPETPDQQALVERDADALADAGIAVVPPEALLGDVHYVAYTNGESYGYLRIVPRGEALDDHEPRDVVVVESAPNDISIVAGLLTQNPQNELGHVNLRLREKGTPNAAVPDIYETEWVAELADQLVHLVVSEERFVLEPADLADAEAFWEAHRPVARAPVANLEPSALAPLTELRAGDADAYGAKCANLGELTRVLSAPQRPDGFGIPFVHYRDFMAASGLDAELEALLATDLRGDARTRRAALKTLRDRIKAEPPDPALLAAVAAAIDQVFGAAGRTQSMRLRSSTNVEDLDAFTGAGLYDSRSGCLADDLDGDSAGPSACLLPEKAAELERQLTEYRAELAEHPERTYLAELIADAEQDLSEEKPIAAALGKVWASLWNDRAFDERAYYGIDHRLAYMGICVHPAYALERINAVAVSNLQVDEGDPLYRLNSQVGELSVVRPEIPTAVAEVLTFRRAEGASEPSAIELHTGSSLVPEGEQVWPEAELRLLAGLLFRVHDHFAREVYPAISPLALDFEVKLERDGEVVIKQVRPYVSTEP